MTRVCPRCHFTHGSGEAAGERAVTGAAASVAMRRRERSRRLRSRCPAPGSASTRAPAPRRLVSWPSPGDRPGKPARNGSPRRAGQATRSNPAPWPGMPRGSSAENRSLGLPLPAQWQEPHPADAGGTGGPAPPRPMTALAAWCPSARRNGVGRCRSRSETIDGWPGAAPAGPPAQPTRWGPSSPASGGVSRPEGPVALPRAARSGQSRTLGMLPPGPCGRSASSGSDGKSISPRVNAAGTGTWKSTDAAARRPRCRRGCRGGRPAHPVRRCEARSGHASVRRRRAVFPWSRTRAARTGRAALPGARPKACEDSDRRAGRMPGSWPVRPASSGVSPESRFRPFPRSAFRVDADIERGASAGAGQGQRMVCPAGRRPRAPGKTGRPVRSRARRALLDLLQPCVYGGVIYIHRHFTHGWTML